VNADLSVAPEIAQLAVSSVPPPQARALPAPHTAGRIAAALSGLAAAPQRWWDLVRFDPDGPVRIPVPGADGSWLLVLPPGATADCDCRYATLLAGEAAETPLPQTKPPAPAAKPPAPARPLRPGRVRVHGRHAAHRIQGAGHGYSVSLHWADGDVRSEEMRDFHPERPVADLSQESRSVLSAQPATQAIPPGSRAESSLRPTRSTMPCGQTRHV
jgi:hypothetical protein